jgi:hypothetical protein
MRDRGPIFLLLLGAALMLLTLSAPGVWATPSQSPLRQTVPTFTPVGQEPPPTATPQPPTSTPVPQPPTPTPEMPTREPPTSEPPTSKPPTSEPPTEMVTATPPLATPLPTVVRIVLPNTGGGRRPLGLAAALIGLASLVIALGLRRRVG